MYISNKLTYITFITEIIPLIFCIFFYKKLNTKALKVFFYYVIFLSFSVIASVITLQLLKSQAIYYVILKLYTLFEFTLVAYFLRSIIKNTTVVKVLKYSMYVFVPVCIYFYIITNSSRFSTYPSIIEFLFFIMVLIYFFYEKIKTVIIYPLYQSHTFWICVGFFIYFTGNFFFFLFSNTTSDKSFITQLNIIYSFVTIIKNIILSLSLLVNEPIELNDDEFHIPTDINLDEFTLTNFKKL